MHPSRIAVPLLLSALLSACVTTQEKPAAGAVMDSRSASAVRGTVSFTPQEGNILVKTDITGLTPGEHGFHIHEVGNCSAADASSAKGHFNPGGKSHGHHGGHERHAGDMPNLAADHYGTARTSFIVTGLSFEGANSILGRSVVIHAAPDDYASQPAGNSGARVACGVINPA